MIARAARPVRLLAVAAFVVACGGERLGSEIESEEVLEDLGGILGEPTARVLLHAAPKAPGRLAWVVPSGRPVTRRVRVPPDAALTVEFGVGTDTGPVTGPPVRFTVRVDGTEQVAKTLDPATEKRHRHWHATRVDLGAFAAREVELALDASVTGSGTGAGSPAWTRVELVRVHRAARQRATPGLPNVVVLLVDTLRADVLGCYGATPGRSPTLDALAATGLLFEDAVAPAPWTLPSVASLFTGRYPREHGVTVPLADRPAADWDGGTYLATSIPTLATLLQRAGVTTFASVANALIGPDTGLAMGFDGFELPSPRDDTRRFASGHEINRRFLEWAASHRDLRFFAYLHYMEMHSPYVPTAGPPPPPDAPETIRKGDATTISREVRAGAVPPRPDEIAYLKALYDGSLVDWDGMLAELLRGLEGLGLRERTILLVTADHGEEFLEHGQLAHGKQLFEESLRVPLVIAGPGVPVGRRSDPVELIDLLPTIAARLGAAAPSGLVGRDVLAPPATAMRPAFAEIRSGVGFGERDVTLAMVREPPWKLLWTPDGGKTALFHLRDDPGERTNRTADAAVADRLLAAGREYWAHRVLAETPLAAPDLTEKLRNLGYVE